MRRKREQEPSWLQAENGGGLAEWDLWKNRDYYPAGVMSDTTCEHNFLLAKCGENCKCYTLGNCPIADEIEEQTREGFEDGKKN